MARAKWMFGAPQNASPDGHKAIPIPPPSNADAKKFGLENFGNTCYANSVIQALYFCTPFRELLLQSEDYVLAEESQEALPSGESTPPPSLTHGRGKPERRPSTSNGIPEAAPIPAAIPAASAPVPPTPPSLFSALRSLYLQISTSDTDKGTVAPRAFIDKVREGNEIFRSSMHQDAHEFLNYLLNKIVEEVEEQRRAAQESGDLYNSIATLSSGLPPTIITAPSSNSGRSPQDATLVHKLFEGILTSETRCLTCETVSARDESFLDLSIDIEQNSSVTACLRQFSASEMLCHKNKFFCDSCCDLQEAEKRMKIKKLPNVLALHLKRFKYQEDLQKYIKLAYRVAFPYELRLFNTVDDTDDADRLYNLFAIVVHIGNGPHHGHYISIIKTGGSWLVFDDESVYPLPENDIPKYFGESNAGAAYVLYYQAADIDLPDLGIRRPSPVASDLKESAPTKTDPLASPNDGPNPPLPPGLVEEENSSDLSDPPFPLTPSQPSSPVLQPTDIPGRHALEIKVTGLDEPPPTPLSAASATASVSSSVNGSTPRKSLFGTVKKRPSTSASVSNGSNGRRFVAEKSDNPPTKYADVQGSDLSSHPSTSSRPASPSRESSEPRHKEPERKSSTWFKRKSGRLDKSRPGSSHGLLAPSSHEKRQSEPNFFDVSALQALSTGRVRPKPSGAGLSAGSDERHRRHEWETSSPAGSATSSVGSTSHGLPNMSSSAHYQNGHPPVSPTRLSHDRSSSSPKSPDHKKSLSHFSSFPKAKSKEGRSIQRPATSDGHRMSVSHDSEPPVPPIPKAFAPPNSPARSNGYANGHIDHAGDLDKHKPGHSHMADATVIGISPSTGGNQSTSSTTSSSSNASSNWKRTSRKLSLTMGLGFGKKEKKEKEREKEGKGPPSAFNPNQITFTNS